MPEKLEARGLIHPSLFTFFGRHSTAWHCIKTLLRSKLGKVLDLGSGPIEPAILMSVLKENCLSFMAFDGNEKVIGLANRLNAGESVLVEEVAQLCTNFKDDGSPMKNTDFEPEVLAGHMERVRRMLGVVPFKCEGGKFTQTSSYPNLRINCADLLRITAEDSEFSEILSGADILYMGGLLVNLRKIISDDALIAWLKELRQRFHGIFIASLTPLDLMGDKSTLDLLKQSGFDVRAVLCDKFVVMGNRLLGDFECIFGSDEQVDTLLGSVRNALIQDGQFSATTVTQLQLAYSQGDADIAVAWLYNPDGSICLYRTSADWTQGAGHIYWNRLIETLIGS